MNDYTLVRNMPVEFKSVSAQPGLALGCLVSQRYGPWKSVCLQNMRMKPLVGDKSGSVSVGPGGDWAKWTYFPKLGFEWHRKFVGFMND